MTPEEELARLNRVIHQYESVFKTTTDSEQRRRVVKQLKDLKDYREKLVAVNVLDAKAEEQAEETSDDLAQFPFLRTLVAREADLQPRLRVPHFWAREQEPTPAQREIFHLMLHMRWFREEFLPFLTEKRLKLDFKFSLDRDGFYARFQDVERKLEDFREEVTRLGEGVAGREMELEVRKRMSKLTRQIEADASKLFQAVKVFARELVEDADGEGVKCLNGAERIAFDSIEGTRVLEGRTVRGALDELARLASEVEEYLNVPDIESQER